MTTPRPRHHALAVLTLLCLLLLGAPAAAQLSPSSRDMDNGGGAGIPAAQQSSTSPSSSTGSSFSAPMVVLLVALIAGFFFIGFFSVYMRRCGRAPSGGLRISAAALRALAREEEEQQRNQRNQRGLDPAVVASFPTIRYADAKQLRVGGGGKDAALECAVCLSEFDDHEELRLLPTCSHAFHPDCIGEWLAAHVTCPVCRCNLDPAEGEVPAVAAAEAATASSGEATATAATTGEEQQRQEDQVAIVVDVTHDHGGAEEKEEEAKELERIGTQRRALRSRSGRPSAAAAPPVPVPRSHSTGHSLAARLDGDLERFTLRLPEHVRREMVEESLRRTGPREREGERDGARSARSDRWPAFIARTFSSRVPFWSSSSRRAPPDLEAPSAAVAAAAGTTTGSARTTTTRREKTSGVADGTVTAAANKGSVRFDCLGVVTPAVTGARVGAAAGDSETEDEADEEKPIARHRQD